MEHPRNEQLLTLARNLRKNMTKEERHLWYGFLKTYPIPFRRQEIIGNYIVDFYCEKAKLAVELDGSQHFEKKGKNHDSERTKNISGFGISVIRFSNSDVLKNFEGVCLKIEEAVVFRMEHPSAKVPKWDD